MLAPGSTVTASDYTGLRMGLSPWVWVLVSATAITGILWMTHTTILTDTASTPNMARGLIADMPPADACYRSDVCGPLMVCVGERSGSVTEYAATETGRGCAGVYEVLLNRGRSAPLPTERPDHALNEQPGPP